jgi:hypothetical protein
MQILRVWSIALARNRIGSRESRRRLDANDVGAPIGKLTRSRRPRAMRGEIDDREAVER